MQEMKTLHEVCDAIGVTRRAVQGYEKSDSFVLYVGYYIDELETFHMLNCNTAEYWKFEYIE